MENMSGMQPTMKDFDICQEFGNSVSMASEMFLTIVCIVSHASWPPACATRCKMSVLHTLTQ